jgi:hypothetical protein
MPIKRQPDSGQGMGDGLRAVFFAAQKGSLSAALLAEDPILYYNSVIKYHEKKLCVNGAP